MTDTALLEKGDPNPSQWARRTVLVGFCVVLLGTLGVVFTRVVAERVPQQRATLEKLIAERTGLAVRFDNVHFAWSIDGTNAVFTRVELTDPAAGRVRVVAPELRVEFDSWDFLRHHQFSLGHVTLVSPDIEIIGDPDEPLIGSGKVRARSAAPGAVNRQDEASQVQRYLSWARLMPTGRIEVEAARVHLIRRGSRSAHSSFTVSQAVVSRSASRFSAYGTMLLAQDVGQLLFVSAKLDGLAPNGQASGDLRLIARRVFLDKLSLPGVAGRGTLDASLHLRDGLIESGKWQASARDLVLNEQVRLDHLTASGTLARDAHDVLLELTDLQLTRGARLERVPKITARLALTPGSTALSRVSVDADRLPYLAVEFVAAALETRGDSPLPALPSGWIATAGEVHELHFDSGAGGAAGNSWSLGARVANAGLSRAADRAQLSRLAARLRLDAEQLELDFDPADAATVMLNDAPDPRPLSLSGRLFVSMRTPAAWRVDDLGLRSAAASLTARGTWSGETATPLALRLQNLDHALLVDAWKLLAPQAPPPAILADIARGNIVEGVLQLTRMPDSASVDWQRSSGKLAFTALESVALDTPPLTSGNGALEFARGSTQLLLAGGRLGEVALTGARIDWPRTGMPRMRATLEGPLNSALLRQVLEGQGLERLTGNVAIEAEARGASELRQVNSWRLTAKVSDASVPLARDLPALENLNGTLRYSNRQLRGLTLTGSWLGGPVAIESRRGSGTGLDFSVNGVADAAPLLKLLGHGELSDRLDGRTPWSGSVQKLAGNDAWAISLASNFAGIESRLPEPFDKLRGRLQTVSARIRIDAGGVREFDVDGDRMKIRGQVESGVTEAHVDVQGVTAVLRSGREANADPALDVSTIELRQAPLLLAAAGAVLPRDGTLTVAIGDLRYSGRSLGPLHAGIARRADVVEFSLDSPQTALHRLSAQGSCDTANECRAQFSADTNHLAALLRGAQLPAEWPTESLHAVGELDWPLAASDYTRALNGRFDLETDGADRGHQLLVNATLDDGQIALDNVQGSGPDPDQVFRGTGRVSLLTRRYDLTVDYEPVALAAAAVPTPARARLARAWNSLRGSAARRGWTYAPETRRVQWQGSWEAPGTD